MCAHRPPPSPLPRRVDAPKPAAAAGGKPQLARVASSASCTGLAEPGAAGGSNNITVGVRVRPSAGGASASAPPPADVFSTGKAEVSGGGGGDGDVRITYFSDHRGAEPVGKVAPVDFVFDPRASQADVYDTAARSLVLAVAEGVNASIIAVRGRRWGGRGARG